MLSNLTLGLYPDWLIGSGVGLDSNGTQMKTIHRRIPLGIFFFFKVRSKLQNSDLTSLSDVLSIALLVVEEAERIKKDNETHSGLIREGEKKFKDSQKCERTQENEQQ